MSKNEKKIKNLSIQVTYQVQYGDVQVPDEVFDQLNRSSEINSDDIECSEALDWLSGNVCESNAHDWSYDISDIEEYGVDE